VRQLYPEERDLGVYAYGHALTMLLEPAQTKVLEVSPTKDDLADHSPKVRSDVPACKAFLDLDDVTKSIAPADLWPATPLPGKANMPGF
jgi:hypothetical protein